MILYIRKARLLINNKVSNNIDSLLVYSATKHAVLVVIGISSTFLSIAIAVILVMFIFGSENMTIIIPFSYCVDMMINTLCITFLFRFCTEKYDKLCALCHACAMKKELSSTHQKQ